MMRGCCRNPFGRTFCNSCGVGTRCLGCKCLIAFFLGINWTTDTIPFKDPIIGMFNDIKEKLELNNQYYSQETILGFFRETHDVLTNDCEKCKDYQEILNLSDHISGATDRLGKIVGTNQGTFVTNALYEIALAINLLGKIPNTIYVPRDAFFIDES